MHFAAVRRLPVLAQGCRAGMSAIIEGEEGKRTVGVASACRLICAGRRRAKSPSEWKVWPVRSGIADPRGEHQAVPCE